MQRDQDTACIQNIATATVFFLLIFRHYLIHCCRVCPDLPCVRLIMLIEAKQGVIQFYFRKIPLHQQIFLVVLVCNSMWLPRYLKNLSKMKLLSAFQFGNIKVNILALTAISKCKIRLIL